MSAHIPASREKNPHEKKHPIVAENKQLVIQIGCIGGAIYGEFGHLFI